MKKVILSVAVLAALMTANNAKAQLIDEQNVTVTMDLQPILQLNMNGATNVDFVFDQISEYVGGITQYGVTNLQISSTINWDLYASAFSSNIATGTWDQQVVYGAATDPNAQDDLPLTALELHQDKQNPGAGTFGAGLNDDYSTVFSQALSVGVNCVNVQADPYVRPIADAKYIVGGNNSDNYYTGGTYLIQDAANANAVGGASNFYYSMDYRIVPGLPAVFPNASDYTANNGNSGTVQTAQIDAAANEYAQSGVYTMNVKYVLMEN